MTPFTNRIANIIYPLDDFYQSHGRVLPRIEAIAGVEMPEPYRSLLAHTNDMTPTLEKYCDSKIHLRLLEMFEVEEEEALYRQVVLLANGDETPMEFGAIRINLAGFEDEPMRLIREGYRPLGSIMADYEITHENNPNAFFRIESDVMTREAFGLEKDEMLYGRHNVLSWPNGEILAEVVEILPPILPGEAAGG